MKTVSLPLEVAPRAILALGEDLVRDDRAALEELVKNAYDADARSVRVIFEFQDGTATAIRVVDDGSGMTLADIQRKWLVVATANKVTSSTSAGGRVLTGQKGIGRLSAARLGAYLELATRSASGPPLLLTVNWKDLLSVSKLSDFLIRVAEDPERVKQLGVSHSGTTLRITQLPRRWASADLDDLQQALSRTLNPFAAQAGLHLTLAAEGSTSFQRQLGPPEFIEHPQYRFAGEVRADGTISAKYSYSGRGERPIDAPSRKYPQVLRVNACGPFSFEIRAWDRDSSVLLATAGGAGLDMDLKSIRSVLDQANGFFVYRDGFLAYPKRPDDRDWLGLEARRVNNPTQRLGLSQVVAAAFISRNSNSELRDKSDREGLVDNFPLQQFRDVLEHVLHILETERLLDKPEMGEARGRPHAEIQIDRLAEAAKLVRAGTMPAEQVADLITEESSRLKKAQRALRARWTTLGRLAAVGQLAGVLVHEIAHNLPVLSDLLQNARDELGHGRNVHPVDVLLDGAQTAMRSIQRVVQRFAPFFVGGVRTRRRAADVEKVLDAAFATRSKALREGRVDAEYKANEPLTIKMDGGDALAVFANLLDNAIYWTGMGQGDRKIRVRARRDQSFARVSVTDSGPGIDDNILPRIFEPGFTMRRAGMGLGLSIARDILEAHGGTIEARGSSGLGGAQFILRIPLEKP